MITTGTDSPTRASQATDRSANQGKKNAAGTKVNVPRTSARSQARRARPDPADDGRGPSERQREHRRPDHEDQDPLDRRCSQREHVGNRDGHAKRQGTPETASVQANRLRDELADGAGFQAEAVAEAACSPAGRYSDQPWQRLGEQPEGVVEAPERGPARRSRSRSTLASTAGTPASSHARSTAKPSIASTCELVRAADARARPDRAQHRVRERLRAAVPAGRRRAARAPARAARRHRSRPLPCRARGSAARAPDAPAMPTCRTALGRSSASARAVATAASTGPIPQTTVRAPTTGATSRAVAATTSSTLGGPGGIVTKPPLGRAARPEAASSVAPIATAIDAPCVLASERASHPGNERHSTKPS